MKKIIFGIVAMVMLSIIFPLSSLAATTNNGDGTFTISGKIDNTENKTVTITVFKGKEQKSENLMFIDEIQADETGSFSHTFSTKEVLSVDEPFYLKVASDGMVVEENTIYHPDAMPDEDQDPGEEKPGENPGEGNDEEKPGEKPGDGNDGDDQGNGNTPGNGNDDKDPGQDKDDNRKEQPGENNGNNNNGDKQPNDENKEGDNKLPSTATNFFNFLLVGLLLAGVGAIMIKRRSVAKG